MHQSRCSSKCAAAGAPAGLPLLPHTLMVLSTLPLARRLPGSAATLTTARVWPSSVTLRGTESAYRAHVLHAADRERLRALEEDVKFFSRSLRAGPHSFSSSFIFLSLIPFPRCLCG